MHLCVRAESRHGRRLHPGKAELQRWRETFAERLRGLGIDAETSRQATRGELRNYEPLWRLRAAAKDRRVTTPLRPTKSGARAERSRQEAVAAWAQVIRALASSEQAEDRALAVQADRYVRATPFALNYARRLEQRRHQERKAERDRPKERSVDRLQGPHLER